MSASHFLVLVGRIAAKGAAPTRLGIVASKRVGGAVVRNRCKRLVKEAFRGVWGELPAGVDLVVIVRPGLERLTFDEVRSALVGILPKLRRVAGAGSLAPQ